MWTVVALAAVSACVTTVLGAMGRCPWWVPVGLLALIEIVRVLPLK